MLLTPRKIFLITTLICFSFEVKETDGLPYISEILEIYTLYDTVKGWFEEDPNDKINEKLDDINAKIDQIGIDVKAVKSDTQYIKKHLNVVPVLLESLYDCLDAIDCVKERSDTMQKYISSKGHIKKETLIEFATAQIKGAQNQKSVPDLLNDLKKNVLRTNPVDNQNVLHLLPKYFDLKTTAGKRKVSIQQFLYLFYMELLFTQVKGYLIIQYSKKILDDNEKGPDPCDFNITMNAFNTRGMSIFNGVVDIMKSLDTIVWNVDPEEHILNKTYDEMTRVQQGFILHETELAEEMNVNSGTCESYTPNYKKIDGRRHNVEWWFEPRYSVTKTICEGVLRHCQSKPEEKPYLCPAAKDSSRLYESLMEIGDYCAEKKVNVEWTKTGFMEALVADVCLCICDNAGHDSDRTFSLHSVLSDIKKNMVVTGVRMIKHNRVFHLQIQQGKLEGLGNIDPKSLEWIPLENYVITNDEVKDEVNFHTFTPFNQNMALDEIRAKNPKYLITGVRFTHHGHYKSEAVMQLQIHTTKFKLSTGKLDLTTSNWEDVSFDERHSIDLSNLDNPIKNKNSQPVGTPNQIIKIAHSDRLKDLAQSTIPFIDIQPVTTNPPVPMSGVGIYYKSQPGYGGFIAPKLLTLDFAKYFEAEFPDRKEKIKSNLPCTK